jgi:plasmid stabilization system protein ParE
MAERKIIWSTRAEDELLKVLEFYINRNGNTTYSTKLLNNVEKSVSLLINYPSLGHLTENRITRVIVKDKFMIFYEVDDSYIQVVSFWDTRQDPGTE